MAVNEGLPVVGAVGEAWFTLGGESGFERSGLLASAPPAYDLARALKHPRTTWAILTLLKQPTRHARLQQVRDRRRPWAPPRARRRRAQWGRGAGPERVVLVEVPPGQGLRQARLRAEQGLDLLQLRLGQR